MDTVLPFRRVRLAALGLAGLGILLPGRATPQGMEASVSDAADPRPDFSNVDAWVDATPESAESSVEELAGYLSAAGDGDLQRARAVYRWLTTNVDYDVEGFFRGRYGDLSPEGVLRRRRTVCSGYAGLAQALGQAMGLEVEVVNGWSKGYGYTAGEDFGGPTNHAWNAVRIDGRWHLMDPTWGAGYLMGDQFVPRFLEHYFLTEPRDFAFDHLPSDPEWQLLDDPLTGDEYADLVYLRPAFFFTGLQVQSHPNVRIDSTERLTITLGAPNEVLLTARLLEADGERPVEGQRTFIQVGGGEAWIDAVFPRRGDYILRLFAGPGGGDGTLYWALDYRIRADAGSADFTFPSTYTAFGERGAFLERPIEGVLRAGATERFRLRAPGALGVAVVSGGEWTHLAADGDVFEGDVAIVAGDVVIYAQYEGEESFSGLVGYTAR